MVQKYATGISFIKQQMVVTNTIRQTEIPSLIDSSVTNTPSEKSCVHQKLFHHSLLLFLPEAQNPHRAIPFGSI
jgi:hypothetical protein